METIEKKDKDEVIVEVKNNDKRTIKYRQTPPMIKLSTRIPARKNSVTSVNVPKSVVALYLFSKGLTVKDTFPAMIELLNKVKHNWDHEHITLTAFFTDAVLASVLDTLSKEGMPEEGSDLFLKLKKELECL